MADELKEKKPDLGSGSSSVSAPKAAPTPKMQAPKQASVPAPKTSTPKVSSPMPKQQPKPAAPKQSNPFSGNKMPGFEGMDKLWDNMNNSAQKVIDNRKQQPTMPKPDPVRQEIMNQGFRPNSDKEANKLLQQPQQSQQPNKPGRDYDSLSKELDGGKFVNIDAGLTPYEYGFETNGYEDLAIDARKNPKTGKYELFMYTETENGPVDEPDESYPDHTFDTFDDLKAFIESGYKESKPQAQQTAQKEEWDKNNDPGSATITKELEGWTRNHLKNDGGLSDKFIEQEINRMYSDSKKADFYKGKMKEEYERKKVSQMFGTDLNSPKKSEQDLRDFENSHPFEVEYDYDENGNRNGYELKFSKPEDQEAYEKLFAEVYGGK